MNLPHTSKTLIAATLYPAIVALAIGLFGWLIIYIQNMADTLSGVETKLVALEHERQNIHALEETIKKNLPSINRINNTHINHDRPVEFLEELTNLGKLTHNKIVLDYSEQESNNTSLVFRITIEGAKKYVLTYLHLLELLPYAITVEGINWQNISFSEASSQETTDTRLLLTIRVKTK